MSILDWIDVGKVSAERDINLNNYFYDNGTLKKLIENNNHFLMLGRKGSGKTALFNYFTTNPKDFVNENDKVISISLDDYSWNVHSLLAQNQTADSLAYRQSWKFIFLLEIIKTLSSNCDATKEIKEASRCLEKIFGSPIPGIFDLVKSKILSLSKLKLPHGSIGIEGADNIELDAGEVAFEDVCDNDELKRKLCSNIEGLTRYLERAVDSIISPSYRIYICFDRVDEAWDVASQEVSVKVITGLIAAADSLNQKFKKLVRPIVFLREDIFETLPLNDKNKLREDCGSLLKWDKEGLQNLLLKRINYFAKRNGISDVTNIDALFDREVMRQKMRPTGYILKRTMYRPRDIICFVSKIISALNDQQNDPFNDYEEVKDKLLVSAIYDAEYQYSEWLLEEIKEEWFVQAPEINQLLDAIQNNGSTIIVKHEYKIQLEKLGFDLSQPLHLNEKLKFLYGNSIIGFKIGGQNYWRYKCFYNSQGFSDESEYHIHDGLVKALNLVETRAVQ